MKYILILFLGMLTLKANSQAINWGIKVSGGIADQRFVNKDVISTNSIGTLGFGGFVNYNLPGQFAIQSGLGIANKGAEIVEDGITTTPKITYLDLPLNFIKKYNFPGLGMFYFGAGGYFDYALSGKYKFETPNSVTSEKLEFGSQADVQRNDYGLNFTSGIELNNHLIFDVRYALGLKNIASYPQRDTGTSTIQNRLLTISLGYAFR